MNNINTLEFISGEHLLIISNAVRVFRSKGEQVTENRVIEFTRMHFPEYRDLDLEFLKGIAIFAMVE